MSFGVMNEHFNRTGFPGAVPQQVYKVASFSTFLILLFAELVSYNVYSNLASMGLPTS